MLCLYCHGIDTVAFGTVELFSLMYFLNPVGNSTKQRAHLSNGDAKFGLRPAWMVILLGVCWESGA